MGNNTKILDPQYRENPAGGKWQGAFMSEFLVGLFEKRDNHKSEITAHKFNSKIKTKAPINDLLDAISSDIDKHIDNLQNDQKKHTFALPNTRDLNLDVGPIINAKTTGLVYKPELTIYASPYRLVWQWEVNCQGSLPHKCTAVPRELTIFNDTKDTQLLKPDNSKKWLNIYEAIKKAIGGKPENIVINSLLDKTRLI